MPVRFAYLAVTHAFAALRLLRMTDREKVILKWTDRRSAHFSTAGWSGTR
ncbi:hypothetical protein [Kutzneria buriramensis]|nr:hypothetical protein [Kutzneria buriramensis]